MKTTTARIGKIAQLPHDIREELNLRLFNGTLGSRILPWLNELPEVKEALSGFFSNPAITSQNLSEWRHGGYQDWLHHRERERRIQRLTEEGENLKDREEDLDLFENFARVAAAELTVDLDSLSRLKGNQRAVRMLKLTLNLSRLQNAYNRSRSSLLAWAKWNHRFLIRQDYQNFPRQEKNPPPFASRPEPDQNATASSPSAPQPFRNDSTADKVPEKRIYHVRTIYHRKGCGCICHDCHPDDGPYPYAEAVKDHAAAKETGALCYDRGNVSINTQPIECYCPCNDCDPDRAAQQRSPLLDPAHIIPANISPVKIPAPNPPPPQTPSTSGIQFPTSDASPVQGDETAGKSPNPDPISDPKNQPAPARYDPSADFLRQAAHRKTLTAPITYSARICTSQKSLLGQ